MKLAAHSRVRRLALLGESFADWYEQARAQIGIVCRSEEWNLYDFVSHLAISSPRVRLRRNIRTAIQYTVTFEAFGSTLSSTKAALSRYSMTGELSERAPKVRAFRDALLGDDQAIVLDTWLAYAFNVPAKSFGVARVRAACERRIRNLADRLGITPRACQASVWAGAMSDAVNRGTWQYPPGYYPMVDEWTNWVALGRSYPVVGPVGRVAG